MIKKSIIFLLFFIFPFFIFASDLKVTNILTLPDGKHKKIRLIISNFLVIENIKFYSDGAIELPHYESENKIKYEQVHILNNELYKKMIFAIENNREEDYLNSKINFEIRDIQNLNTNTSRLANVEIVFDKEIIVTCGVMKGKNELWIAWPAFKDKNGRYHKDVYVLRKRLKKEIEQNIIEKYNEMR
ncbi:septation protein SpoVG family protein [bacterium]